MSETPPNRSIPDHRVRGVADDPGGQRRAVPAGSHGAASAGREGTDVGGGKLLTIVVPTYNRADQLEVLLRTLARELPRFGGTVDVIVGDNCSTDRTPEVTAAFKAAWPQAMVLRHERNVGGDENFCRCMERAVTRHAWLIGDDDLPKTGAIERLLPVLRDSDPDLLYLPSEWKTHLEGPDDGTPLDALHLRQLSRDEFARDVNTWITFISGMIVNLQRLRELDPQGSLRRFAASSLVQLGWILPLLAAGNRFYTVRERCVLATAGNTGSYPVIEVFASNFDRLVAEVLGPDSTATRLIGKYNRWTYLPHLLFTSRFGNLGRFEPIDYTRSLAAQRGTLAHRLLLQPIATWPAGPARAMHVLARVPSIWLRLCTKLGWRARRGLGTFADLAERAMRKSRRVIQRLRGAATQPFLGECRGPLHLGHSVALLGRRNIRCLGPVNIMNRNRIETYERHGTHRYRPSIVFGAHVSMEDDCHIGAVDRIELHDNVMLASKVYISDHSHGTTAWEDLRVPPHQRAVVATGPIIIESDVWIGEGAAVLGGVRIGRGSVIGANAVVTRDIPPYCTAAGSPARVLAQRVAPSQPDAPGCGDGIEQRGQAPA